MAGLAEDAGLVFVEPRNLPYCLARREAVCLVVFLYDPGWDPSCLRIRGMTANFCAVMRAMFSLLKPHA